MKTQNDARMQDDVLKYFVKSNEEYKIIRAADERRIYLTREISTVDEQVDQSYLSSTGWIVEQINEFNREDNKNKVSADKRKPIKLYIDCFGGDVIEGLKLVDTITLSKTPVWTINMGRWYSMAFYIGIVGYKRLALPRSMFLLHDGYAVLNNTTNKARDEADFFNRIDDEVLRRIVLEHSKMTKKDFEKIKDREYYMFSKEALEKGFIDKIIKNINDIL